MPKKHPPRYAKNLEEAALSLGVSKQTLMGWGQASGCPCKREHKVDGFGYDLQLIRRWAVQNGYAVDATTGRISGSRSGRMSEDATNGKPSIALQFKTAQADEKLAKASLVQLELKLREGEVHSIADCEDQTRRRHLYMLRTLKMKARTMGPRLAGKTALEAQVEMEAMVEEIMLVFSGEAE